MQPARRLSGEPVAGPAVGIISDERLPSLEGLQRHRPAPKLDRSETLREEAREDEESREISSERAQTYGRHPSQSHAADILSHHLRTGRTGQGQSPPHGGEVQVLIQHRRKGGAEREAAQEQEGSQRSTHEEPGAGQESGGEELHVQESGHARGLQSDRMGIVDRVPQEVQRVPLRGELPEPSGGRASSHQPRVHAGEELSLV